VNPLPYKIAVLVYVFDDVGRMLLLHRVKAPNQNLYSPIGGKLEQAIGESPYACALREIKEEIDIQLALGDIRLLGMVSERAFEGQTHWLMFCFEVTRPLNFPERTMNEGRLEWVVPEKMLELPIPDTDRAVIWPLVRQHSWGLNPQRRGVESTFAVYIDCRQAGALRATVEHPVARLHNGAASEPRP
jgi:8-oxo-dGTP diphosphatase